MANEFQDFIAGLENIGFYDIALPFLLIFTIVFGILQKVKIFGDDSKKFNAIIALVMAFLVVRTNAIVEVMNEFLPSISLMAVIIIVILLLVGILVVPKDQSGFTGWVAGLGIIVILIAVGISFFSSTGALGWQLPQWMDLSTEDWRLLVGIGIFLAFIAWITADSSKTPTTLQNIVKGLESVAGGFGKNK